MLKVLKRAIREQTSEVHGLMLESGTNSDIRDMMLKSSISPNSKLGDLALDVEIEDDKELDKIISMIPESDIDSELTDDDLRQIEESYIPESFI